jgi:RHS repeat-associated protein
LLAIHSDAFSGGTVATPLTRYGYELDSLGRRKKATMVDGSNWNYGYNDRSEVTSAVRKNSSGTAIPALGATYSYDGIGNRLSSTSPVLGDRSYVPNSLNQYASITTSATRTVTGRAPAADGVSVNGTALTGGNRIGDIFQFTLPAAANTNSPVWQAASVVSQGTTIDRAFYHPKAVTAPTYDLDGNLVNDGRWVYSWDLENRLTQMESTPQAVSAGAPYRKLFFRYDAGGRRLSKAVYHGTAAAPVFFSSTRWVYDGWNPVSEFTATAEMGGTVTRTKSYTWGLDLSGSLQGAGGVGGLLAVTVHNGFSNTNYCPSYDGNGNIVAWTLEGQTVPVARREYDAFGNTLVEQGSSPSTFGFSTKLQDAETGLYYYGYRYLEPLTGRWLSRDPIGEDGGFNLYGCNLNNSVDQIDLLGMRVVKDGPTTVTADTGLTGLKVTFKVTVEGVAHGDENSPPQITDVTHSVSGRTTVSIGLGLTLGLVGASLEVKVENLKLIDEKCEQRGQDFQLITHKYQLDVKGVVSRDFVAYHPKDDVDFGKIYFTLKDSGCGKCDK